MNKKVVVLTTGGTIAMRYDPQSGGNVPAVTGAELLQAVPALATVGTVEVREFSNMPSGYMNAQTMEKLGIQVTNILSEDDVVGIVITHGTDSLEETAYFLDLFVQSDKPVCITGAMRHAAETSPDGPLNIFSAVRTAFCKEAYGKGVLVVMNDEIHAAREATKTHAGNVKTFASPFWGPLGYADPDRIIFRRDSIGLQKMHPKTIEPDVYLVKLVSGADDFFFNCLIEKGVKGIVVEGLGRGNVPPVAAKGIRAAIAHGIVVVLTTRCLGGRALGLYAYDGGVIGLEKDGVIVAGELNGPKARIKLMFALGLTSDRNQIASYFDTP